MLRDAATLYKVDTDAIALKVKQEFAAKEKAKKAPKPETQTATNLVEAEDALQDAERMFYFGSYPRLGFIPCLL